MLRSVLVLLFLFLAGCTSNSIVLLADACDAAAGAIRVAAVANTAPRALKPNQVAAVDLAIPVIKESCALPPPTDAQTALAKVRNAVTSLAAVGITDKGVTP